MKRRTKIIHSVLALTLLTMSLPALGHDLAVEAPGLNGTGFKLVMNYRAANPTEASVLSNHPNDETVYRTSFLLHLPIASVSSLPDPSFIYYFQTFGTGFFFGAPVGPVLRAGLHKANGIYNVRIFTFDNQKNRRATGNCPIPTDTDVRIQIEWAAQQGGTDNLKLSTFVNDILDCESLVIGGLTNGFITQSDQLFITKPDAATVLPSDVTLWVDEFSSFRTLAP